MTHHRAANWPPQGSFLWPPTNPAISDEAAKRIRGQIRSWRLHLHSGSTLKELAREINMIVRWWINYYGRFYRSELNTSLNRINDYWCGGSCKK